MEYSIQAQNSTNIKQAEHLTGASYIKRQRADLSYPVDSVSFGKNKIPKDSSKGMPKWLKAGLISVAAIGVGVLAYVLTKGKIGSKEVKQLAEHIDFKEAKSLEEAMNFGKTHLGIKEYKGFEERDLEVINWINEGFVNISNKLKGRAVIPETVEYTTKNSVGKGTEGFWQSASANKKVYKINKNIYANIDKQIKEFLDLIIVADEKNQATIRLANCDKENLKNIVTQVVAYNKGQLKTFKQKVKLLNNLYEYSSSIAIKSKYEPVSEFSINYHEGGHLLTKNIRKYVGKASDQDIAELISHRAKEDQAELLAEWFRKHMEGIPMAPEATEYVKKLGGLPIEDLLK